MRVLPSRTLHLLSILCSAITCLYLVYLNRRIENDKRLMIQPCKEFDRTALRTENDVKTITAVESHQPEYYALTMLSVFNGNKWPGYENFTIDELNERDKEILDTLESNINHDLVKELHLFYRDEESLKLVKERRFGNAQKIVPVKLKRLVHMADFFLHANKNLLDKTVIAMNGDIMLGDGFDKVNTTRLRDEKVMYTLTRHGARMQKQNCTTENLCLGQAYQGSHDTHIFRLAASLNETILVDLLDYPINMWQAENGMMWTMKFKFGFTVRNPCPILRTHHNHCSKVHGPSLSAKRYSIVNIPGKNWSHKQHFKPSLARYEHRFNYGKNTA